jgi:hypothetical protein
VLNGNEATMTTNYVSERALAARVDRKLWRTEGQRLRKLSGRSPWHQQYGDYITEENNMIRQSNVDLEELARELHVMRSNEQMEVSNG